MASRGAIDPSDPVLVEDLFDGWLTMPYMEDFFVPLRTTKDNNEAEHFQVSTSDGASLVQMNSQDTRTHPPYAQRQCSPLRVHAHPDRQILQEAHTVGSDRMLRQRRGHTKSRLGCITCKKRKVKCSETWPSCTNCTKRGAICRYPSVFKDVHRERITSEVLGPRPFVKLPDTPTAFGAHDMRMYHHYMVAAYPCIPHAYEHIWLNDVPLLSHQHPSLMHAILALAGSHEAIQVDEPKVRAALSHRQKAIKGLEQSFASWPPPAEEAHIMLATSYLLCFQSSYIEDGFLEHILSLRGCAVLSQLILNESFDGLFAVRVNMHNVFLDSKFKSFPHLDQELAIEALMSIQELRQILALLAADSIEKAIVASLVETVRPLLEHNYDSRSDVESIDTSSLTNPSTISIKINSPKTTPYGRIHIQNPMCHADPRLDFDLLPWDKLLTPPGPEPDPVRSFNALMYSLLILANWPQDSLMHLFDPTNQVGNIVMVHFLAVRCVVSPLSSPQTGMKTPVRAMVKWIERIMDAIEDDGEAEWTKYVVWPAKVLRCMKACVERKKGLMFEDVYEMLLNDPGAFKEGRASKQASRSMRRAGGW
ncbi:hypothetical protein FB567DRAFT_519984 [Paraphoma chrysanthemicola]|uniref:Zn(2)-C6 fungal-type domain-containing protein n=1 Tax=Paraphoma chrysanthemicola TaxID=798071 RepID=A0A8K0RAU9_9PLEO|nr:hypothetical protein FB567DRAFT_519984 [Paraphoma chrysanthemicola]